MKRLNGKAALVTGGASGLGRAIAMRLASEGAKVVITDIQASVGRATAAELGFTFLEHDVTKEDQWRHVIEHIVAQFGALHVLVNNAGIVGPLDRSDLAAARGVEPESVLREMREETPLQEFALPEDVAAVVAYLASDESRSTTGAKLMVDGGSIDCPGYRPEKK